MAYKPEQREYRDVFSVLTATEQPAERGSAYVVEGYATTFDEPYEIGAGSWKWNECIKRDAFMGADMTDVIFQLNHEGQTLARQRTKTLELTVDDHGLKVRADLSGSQKGRELYEAINNGLIDRMSWGFSIAEDGVEYDETTRTSYITKVDKVFDVSAVSIPANQDTEIHARSYVHGVMEKELQELQEQKKEKRQRLAAALELRTL